jgi:hypothetical protein
MPDRARGSHHHEFDDTIGSRRGAAACRQVAADDRATPAFCSVLNPPVPGREGCAEVLPGTSHPRFIRIDAKTGKLSTTAASNEARETVAASVSRADGLLTLQGVESGRVYSLFIQESTGQATFASAAEGRTVSVFAACTPSIDN